MQIRVKRLPHAEGLALPAAATGGAAGSDLRAAVEEPVVLEPGAFVAVPTGLCL
ncbi:MAG: dUTP diphosphatase, partial [Acidobacteriota bacterium]